MSRTVTISDDLATLLEERQKQAGYPSLDAAAEALIAHGLIANDLSDDHSDGRTDTELRALIDDAEDSGDEAAWDASAVKREVLRRYASRGG
jgi:hypothetical protein